MRACWLPCAWTGQEVSRTSACGLHTHFNDVLRGEGSRSGWREWGRKDRQLSALEGSEHRCWQQQMAGCCRAVYSPVPHRRRRGQGRPLRLPSRHSLSQQRWPLHLVCTAAPRPTPQYPSQARPRVWSYPGETAELQVYQHS